MLYYAVDIGSSSIKGAVIDPLRGQMRVVRPHPFPQPLPAHSPGQFEVDAFAVVEATRTMLDELDSVSRESCSGVWFCCQMGGVLLIDRCGEPLTPYVSWRDQRSTQPAADGGKTVLERLTERMDPQIWRSMGNELRAGSATTLLFEMASRGELPCGAMPVTLGDFVVGRLCGVPPVTEFTQALGTLNLETGDWNWELFRQLGLDQLTWPRLVSTEQAIGELKLHKGTALCFPVIGDHQAALYGAELACDELSINVSTGSQVSIVTERFEPGAYQSRPFLQGRFLNTITHLPAGRSLDVLIRLLTELPAAAKPEMSTVWDYILSSADRAEQSGGLEVDLAFFSGPMGDSGKIQGITTENLTIGHLFHAAITNMAANYASCAERLRPGKDWRRIVFSGGLAQKFGLLRRLVSERLPGPSRLCESTEDTLQGLMRLAIATGPRS